MTRENALAVECGCGGAIAPLSRAVRGVLGGSVAERRGRRVTVLLVGVVLMSLADLLITLAYVQANWMMEANPIAAWIIRAAPSLWATVAALVTLKIGTVGVCVTLLYRLRRSRAGEVASWTAVAVLAMMAVMWHEYAAHFEETDIVLLAQAYEHAGVLP